MDCEKFVVYNSKAEGSTHLCAASPDEKSVSSVAMDKTLCPT